MRIQFPGLMLLLAVLGSLFPAEAQAQRRAVFRGAFVGPVPGYVGPIYGPWSAPAVGPWYGPARPPGFYSGYSPSFGRYGAPAPAVTAGTGYRGFTPGFVATVPQTTSAVPTPTFAVTPHVVTEEWTTTVPGLRPGVIEIINPTENGTALQYQLDGYSETIPAGKLHRIESDHPWTISFHRGGNFGRASYTLSAGRFKFLGTDTGWELVRMSDSTDPVPAPAPAKAEEPPLTPVQPRLTVPAPVEPSSSSPPPVETKANE